MVTSFAIRTNVNTSHVGRLWQAKAAAYEAADSNAVSELESLLALDSVSICRFFRICRNHGPS